MAWDFIRNGERDRLQIHLQTSPPTPQIVLPKVSEPYYIRQLLEIQPFVQGMRKKVKRQDRSKETKRKGCEISTGPGM